MKKFFVVIAKRKRTCNCGCEQKINKGEKIISFNAGCHGNLKLNCIKNLIK